MRESQKACHRLLVSSLGCREQFSQWMKLLIPIPLVTAVYMAVAALHPLSSSLFRGPKQQAHSAWSWGSSGVY
jgi:hypothetical protein